MISHDSAAVVPHARKLKNLLLLGTGLALCAGLPGTAQAANECGAPPPGGGTVTCAPGTYPAGIDYPGQPEDLTIVLEPGVVSQETVQATSSSLDVDLRLEGRTGTTVSSSQSGVGVGEGVNFISSRGSVYVGADDVSTSGTQASGVVARSYSGTTVIVDTVTTVGDDSRGIEATTNGFFGSSKYAGGDVSVTSGSVQTSGDNGDGIVAVAGSSKYGGGAVTVVSGAVTTQGDGADGIYAVSNTGFKYGAAGAVSVTSESVSTAGDYSNGIIAISEGNSVTVGSGSVGTTGSSAQGIVARSGGGAINITSGTVTTEGDYSDGIVADSTGGEPVPPPYSETLVALAAPVAEAGGISITSGSVSTRGYASTGISATADYGDIFIESGTVTTLGDNSDGIDAYTEVGAINIVSGAVSTSGEESFGILAETRYASEEPPADLTLAAAPVAVPPDISITSGSVTTTGDGSIGIGASTYDGDIYIESGLGEGDTGVHTSGDGALGIAAYTRYGSVTIDSGAVVTEGDGAPAILAVVTGGPGDKYAGGAVSVTSDSITTGGDAGIGILAIGPGAVTVDSGSVATSGKYSAGIVAVSSYAGPVSVTSDSVTTTGPESGGILAANKYGTVTIDSGSVSTAGDYSTGITGLASESVTITSGTVVTTGAYSDGISASQIEPYSYEPYEELTIAALGPEGGVSITSGSVTTSGYDSDGIDAYAETGDIEITSTGTVSTAGDFSHGIVAEAPLGSILIDSHNIATSGDFSNGIEFDAGDTATIVSDAVTTSGFFAEGISGAASGDVGVTSGAIVTTGDLSDGISVHSLSGDTAVASGSVTTSGYFSFGIFTTAEEGTASVTSTSVSTSGDYSLGIAAYGETVHVTSGTVGTTGYGSIGILAAAGGEGEEAPSSLSTQAVGPGGASVVSGSVTTTGDYAHGIVAYSAGGDVEVTSTGTVTVSGAEAVGIIAEAPSGAARLDVNAVNATGAGAPAIFVDAAASSSTTIRGLVRSAQDFTLDADGGPATVTIVGGGTLRGRIDLTDGADRVVNGGTFDAIGTSLFGGGAELFTNTGVTRSVNGAAVLSSVDAFTSSGRIEMNDGAANDRLTIDGTFTGTGGSRLAVDVNFTTGVSDVLATGVAGGSTGVEVNALGQLTGFNTTGILVVDAAPGTSSTAFNLASGAPVHPYVVTTLEFEGATSNFLLFSRPGQAVFETSMFGQALSEIWYWSADTVKAQLGAGRGGDGDSAGGDDGFNELAGSGGASAWVQVQTSEHDRDGRQFSGGSSFDTSYEQQHEGIQGGIDLSLGEQMTLGVTGGIANSDLTFASSGNVLDIESKNIGAYFQYDTGGMFVNALAKVDFIDAETAPGGATPAQFEATSVGLQANVGYRHDLGGTWVEPYGSLSWVDTSIDDLVSAGATISIDDGSSGRLGAGVRFGSAIPVGSGVLEPEGGVEVIHQLAGQGGSDFLFGSTVALDQDYPDTFGQAHAGLNYRSGAFDVFVRGEIEFGDTGFKGIGGRGGVRLKF